MLQINRFVLHVSLVSGIGIETNKRIVTLLDQYSISDLYRFSVTDFMQYASLGQKKAQILVSGLQNKMLLEQEEEAIEKEQVSYLSFLDPDYPEALKDIAMPPAVLYYKGLPLSEYKKLSLLAIVGSRKANHYATHVINSFVPDFVKHNIVIVSGGAIGVDTFAHKATLTAGGKTIVVLGSGLSHWYPYQNKTVFEAVIEKQGTIISEFPMKAKPEAHHFPQRNRIISALSSGVLIVQAAEKSGAYITAQCALDQGKDVFAVPGTIFDDLSAGCHRLLQEGAQVATSSQAILESCFSVAASTDESQKKYDIAPSCSPLQRRLLSLCKEPIYLDDIVEQCDDITYTELQKELSLLQIQGYIDQELSGAFYKTGV